MEQAGCDRVHLVGRAARALINDGAHPRAEALLKQALGDVDEQEQPRLAAGLLELLSRAQWSLGRAEDAREAVARAVELLPEDEAQSPERARIFSRQAKIAMLQGRFSEVLPAARAALAAATDADAGPRADALNAMGLSLILLGDVEEGSDCLREAIAISPAGFERTSAWSNLADALHLVGRSREAYATAEQGLADISGPGRGGDWLTMTLGEIGWDLGEWAAARRRLPPGDRRHVGITFAYVELKRAEVALADAEHEAARASLNRVADLVMGSREPQFIGLAGSLRGELERRGGDLAAARAAVDDGLDAIEFCSEDLARIARMSETGAWIEADAAQRARDLGDAEAEAEAISRAEGFVMRAEACAADGRPVEAARLASARAHLARARGAADPDLDAAAAEEWRALERPYHVAIAELQRAETLASRGDRDAAAEQLTDVLAAAGLLGAVWLRAEAEGLAARARLPMPSAEGEVTEVVPDSRATVGDPFGLTPRERQVLALVADGATNREIGAQLYMAEKTASVHVSRILAKLDVRSRTEAAAVAHRLGFGETTSALTPLRLGGMATPQQPIDSGFGARSTAAEVLEGIDLSGRLAIVTGGYSGLGLETVRALSGAGADVIVPARRREHATEVLAGIERVEVFALDLGDLDSVLACASRFSTPAAASTSSSTTPRSWPAPRRASGRAGRRSSPPTTSGTSRSRTCCGRCSSPTAARASSRSPRPGTSSRRSASTT